MSPLAGFFHSSAAADVVLLAMASELVLLMALGHVPRAVLLALLPGALIVLALRAALAGAPWPWIALPLALSLPFHLADLRERGWLGTVAGRRRALGRTRRRVVTGPRWNKGW